MFLKCRAVLLLVVLFVLSGCSNFSKMPLQPDGFMAKDAQSVLVGRIKIQNKNKPKYQPKLLSINIERGGDNNVFQTPTLITEVENESKDYLFSLAMDPGVATLTNFVLVSRVFPVNGTGVLPFQVPVDFPANSIVYIGNLDVSIVPREEEQPRAGSVIPLIDQSVTGFSSGTYEVDVSDNYDEDLALLMDNYPYLSGREVIKVMLPDWVYPPTEE